MFKKFQWKLFLSICDDLWPLHAVDMWLIKNHVDDYFDFFYQADITTCKQNVCYVTMMFPTKPWYLSSTALISSGWSPFFKETYHDMVILKISMEKHAISTGRDIALQIYCFLSGSKWELHGKYALMMSTGKKWTMCMFSGVGIDIKPLDHSTYQVDKFCT